MRKSVQTLFWICLILFSLGCSPKVITQYQKVECIKPEVPEVPKELSVQFNLYDTEAGRKYCMQAEEAKKLGVNVIRNKAALHECRQILIELKEQ